MQISDYFFLVYFFPIFFVGYLVFSKKNFLLNIWLIICSLFFFYTFGLKQIPLLIMPFAIDFFLASFIHNIRSTSIRKVLLLISLFMNISILGYYKYGEFFLEQFSSLGLLSENYLKFTAQTLLPVGISFLTFQRISYVVDVFRKKISPSSNILTYSTYAVFFPHVLSGPIIRYADVSEYLLSRKFNFLTIFEGFKYISIGLFIKIFVANQLFILEDHLYQHLTELHYVAASLFLIYFGFRIYMDFLSYSLMAKGLAEMIGFHFPDNFDSPYKSNTFQEFWRKWNMTLSSWLRDYVYIPLGGSRKGSVRTQINLFLTMLVAGLWHGASWSFILWGAGHGILLVMERFARRFPERFFNKMFNKYTVFLSVFVLWVPFRLSTWTDFTLFLSKLLVFSHSIHDEYWGKLFLTSLPAILFAIFWSFMIQERKIANIKPSLIKVVGFFILFFISLCYSTIRSGTPFIYAQF